MVRSVGNYCEQRQGRRAFICFNMREDEFEADFKAEFEGKQMT